MAVFRPAALASVPGAQSAIAPAVTSSKSAGDGAAAQTVSTQPEAPYIVFAVILFVIGLGVGLWLQYHYHPKFTNLPTVAPGVGVFSLFYVMAQSIERVLVPVSWVGGGFLGGGKLGTKRDLAKIRQLTHVEANQDPSDTEKAQAAANAKHDAEQYAANLTAVTFGAAATLAMLVSGYTGLFLLTTVGLHVSALLDLVVTGLAIAGGTKPLHDLITNISSTSQTKQAP
jgi:hypothetical protein